MTLGQQTRCIFYSPRLQSLHSTCCCHEKYQTEFYELCSWSGCFDSIHQLRQVQSLQLPSSLASSMRLSPRAATVTSFKVLHGTLSYNKLYQSFWRLELTVLQSAISRFLESFQKNGTLFILRVKTAEQYGTGMNLYQQWGLAGSNKLHSVTCGYCLAVAVAAVQCSEKMGFWDRAHCKTSLWCQARRR